MATFNDALYQDREISVCIKDIPIEKISIKKNIRKEYEDIDALKVSIQQYGLLQPIMVYRNSEDSYTIKTGHRRFLAYQSLYHDAPDTFNSIRCIVSDDQNISIVQLIENLQRSDISQQDLFHALVSLKEQGCSLKQIGEIMGQSENSVKVIFTGINEIKQDPHLQAYIESPGGTIRDVVDTKGIPNRIERLDLLEQRKAGVLTRAEMRQKTRSLKAENQEESNMYKVFLKVNKAERSMLLTFQEDIPFDIMVNDLKNFLNCKNLICINPDIQSSN
ncbi:MAG: ParB N-terminal domain-containing protein [Treponema sp.]|jgi:ParB family chromosome partitioning protein|nr:ParB N-terminal domain-containing protein [Treponema sp.]